MASIYGRMTFTSDILIFSLISVNMVSADEITKADHNVDQEASEVQGNVIITVT